MTTPRTRRNKPQQARDILLALLKEQDAKAEKLHLLWEDAIEEADRTRRAIELLDQAMLPGMEPEPLVEIGLLSPDGELIGTTSTSATPVIEVPDAQMVVGVRPHRQRIGEKAQGISDVWEAGDGTVTVHSALMYARQDACEWCRKGVPFATEARTSHYVTSGSDSEGKGKTEYKPCTGVKE